MRSFYHCPNTESLQKDVPTSFRLERAEIFGPFPLRLSLHTNQHQQHHGSGWNPVGDSPRNSTLVLGLASDSNQVISTISFYEKEEIHLRTHLCDSVVMASWLFYLPE